MVLKVHGSFDSTCTQRVLVVLEEKKVPYELIPIDFVKKEHKSPEHLQKQPFGKVPVLELEDGSLLYESRVITRYIALRFRDQGTDLYPAPTDLKSWALVEQAISVEVCHYETYVSGLAYEKRYKAWLGHGPTDEAQVTTYTSQLEATLDIYEDTLSRQKYLCGERISLADLSHLPFGILNWELGLEEIYAKYPAVHAWLKSMQSRPSWQKIHP